MQSKTGSTEMPAFLDRILQCEIGDSNIVMINKVATSNPKSPLSEPDQEETRENSSFDITGSPLKVDLHGTLIDGILADNTIVEGPKWIPEDCLYQPLPFNEARDEINDKVNLGPSKSHYLALCDGNDHENTIVLGGSRDSNSFTTTLIEKLSIERSEDTKLEAILQRHLQAEIDESHLIQWFFLHGVDLKRRNSEKHYGSVCLEQSQAMVHKMHLKDLPRNQLKIQLIAGHPQSPLHHFWLEYGFVNVLVAQLQDCSASTVISAHGLDAETIVEHFPSLLLAPKKRCRSKTGEPLILDNLRTYNLLDEVWLLLKQCKNVATLKTALATLFDELFQKQPNFHIENSCFAANLFADLANRKVCVRQINHRQSLELLIDLGLCKLNNDYFALLKSFKEFTSKDITQKWAILESTTKRKVQKDSIMLFDDSDLISLTCFQAKLKCLKQIHVAVDLMCFLKDKLSAEWLYESAQKIYTTYLGKDTENSAEDLTKVRLYELSVAVDQRDGVDLKPLTPKYWRFQISTKKTQVEKDFAYYFSNEPIFPAFAGELLKGNSDLSLDENHIYGAKMLKTGIELPRFP